MYLLYYFIMSIIYDLFIDIIQITRRLDVCIVFICIYMYVIILKVKIFVL